MAFGMPHTGPALLPAIGTGSIYEDQPDRIWIVAVAHLSRRPGYWAQRLE